MRLVRAHDFSDFRGAARLLASAHVKPGDVLWEGDARQPSLFAELAQGVDDLPVPTHAFNVPQRYVKCASYAVLSRADDRFSLAYRVLYRLTHGEPALMDAEVDPDVRALVRRAQDVRKDEHRMHAFVRFRASERDGEPEFVAWYAPQHHILRLTAPFFMRRFAAQRFTLFTPDESVSWDRQELRYGPGAPRESAPETDELEALFRTYYGATFNPARTNLELFQRHVPREFQRDMPELRELNALARRAAPSAPQPEARATAPDLEALAHELTHCRACPLYGPATQVVPGEGARDARIMLIGEQPGDEEDRQGRPFVGPAGALLERALAAAGIARAQLFVSNAVKHFSYRPVGKRRLHMKPEWSAVEACRPWLEQEVALVGPTVIVCLGVTAAQSFFGRRFALAQNLGRTFQTRWARALIVTYHPSAILRSPGEAEQHEKYEALVRDLARAVQLTSGTEDARSAGDGPR